MKRVALLGLFAVLLTSCGNDSVIGVWEADDPLSKDGFVTSTTIKDMEPPVSSPSFETIKKGTEDEYQNGRASFIATYRGSVLTMKEDSTFTWELYDDVKEDKVALTGKFRENKFKTRMYFLFDSPWEKGMEIIPHLEARWNITNGKKLNLLLLEPQRKLDKVLHLSRG